MIKRFKKIAFELVVRNKKGREVWKDLSTGNYWSDRTDKLDSRYWPCVREEMDELVDLRNITFDYPTKEDFQYAFNSGFTEVLPKMDQSSCYKRDDSIWVSPASDTFEGSKRLQYIFDAFTGKFIGVDWYNTGNSSAYLRCIGK